nr:LacI family DNA-binding transcriptional regulator [Crossiella equi]
MSRSIASGALNEDACVSSRAREEVLDAASELGYSPNQAARSLAPGAPTRSRWCSRSRRPRSWRTRTSPRSSAARSGSCPRWAARC